MSLFGMMGFGDVMGDDPFFGPTMRHMDNMMNSMNSMFAGPFGMMGGMGLMGNNIARHNAIQDGRSMEMTPFGRAPFSPMFGFPNINTMFQGIQNMANDPNAHSYSSSTVMTMVNGPDGRPQVYQASSSTRSAPGGVKETKKHVIDTRSGTKKMAIGHHIGERAHIMEREQNTNTGEIEGRDDLINLDLDEKDRFEAEWQEKTRTGNALYGHHEQSSIQRGGYSHARPALPPAGHSGHSGHSRVEITEITDEDDSALTNSPAGSSSPIIEYPSQTHTQSQAHSHHQRRNERRSRSREIREREGSRKRDLSDDTEEYRHKYKSRKSRQH